MGNLLRYIRRLAFLGVLLAMGCTSGGSETPPEESIVAQPAARALLPAALGRVPDSDVHRNVLLPPGPGNPRDSEGDFITLADGRVMFVYTRFTGRGGDQDQADLAARFSSDQGRSWTEDDVMVVANEGDQNVMSASLLRLAGGEIALFYLVKNSLEDTRPVMRLSTDEGGTWGGPAEIIPDDDIGYYVLNNDRVVLLESGRLIAPVSQHASEDRI